jgi:arsenate reductase-like glutaredoxin family protein
MNMKENPPPRQEAIRLMAENPNLVRRPLLVKGEQIVYGFDPQAMELLL